MRIFEQIFYKNHWVLLHSRPQSRPVILAAGGWVLTNQKERPWEQGCLLMYSVAQTTAKPAHLLCALPTPHLPLIPLKIKQSFMLRVWIQERDFRSGFSSGIFGTSDKKLFFNLLNPILLEEIQYQLSCLSTSLKQLVTPFAIKLSKSLWHGPRAFLVKH